MRLPKHLLPWLAFAHDAGAAHGVDPMLVLAVIDRESLGGLTLTPVGPTGTGDDGHGLGLMQIDERYHGDWARKTNDDGVALWQLPGENIDMGASILAANLHTLEGYEPGAVCAYNASMAKVRTTLARLADAGEATRLLALDRLTTGGNYVTDTLARRTRYAG